MYLCKFEGEEEEVEKKEEIGEESKMDEEISSKNPSAWIKSLSSINNMI
jgi:hypothetical protein